MDNFMDKLAQKLNAQEMIKANSAADAAQMNKMQSQMEEYDAALQEIRKLGLKNVEAAEQLNQLIAESSKKVDELTKAGIEKIEAIQQEDNRAELVEKMKESNALLADEMNAKLTQLSESLEANKKEIEELFKKTEEHVHTEDVKVYRNVQAVIVEENEKQTELLCDVQTASGKKNTAIMIIGIITMVGVLADLGVNLAKIFGLL